MQFKCSAINKNYNANITLHTTVAMLLGVGAVYKNQEIKIGVKRAEILSTVKLRYSMKWVFLVSIDSFVHHMDCPIRKGRGQKCLVLHFLEEEIK